MKLTQGNNMLKPSLLLSTLSVAISVAMGASTAIAADGVNEIEEVLITARRKTENLQDVPIAVSAFGAEQLKQRGIETEADLQMSTPGLMVRVTNSSNQLNFSIRGQTVDSFSNSQPAVLAYINEVQAGGVSSSAFFDMASIQVLKGPQGTLFGRNATGGAVLYSTQTPEDEFGGYVRAGFGSFSNQEFEGAINVPLSDNLAMRVAGLTRERDGWQTNLYNGDKLASIDSDNIRLSLSYTGDTIENHFSAYFADNGGKTEGLRIRNAYNCLATANGVCIQGEPNPNNPSVNVGDLLFATELYPTGVLLAPAGSAGDLVTDNPRLIELGQQYGFTGFGEYVAVQQSRPLDEVFNDQSNDSEIEQTLISNTTTIELSDSMTLKNIIGYNKVESFQQTDPDGSPFMMLRMGDEYVDTGGYTYNTEQMSDELQISGEMFDDKLDYIVGAYFYSEEFENDIPLKFIADYLTDPFGGAFTYHSLVEDESKSVFAQGSYALSDVVNLTVGARHTWEEVSISHFNDSRYVLANNLKGTYTAKEDRPSWLISLDYRLNDEHMVYFSHRGSWRTGGFNNTSINDIALDNDPATGADLTQGDDLPDAFKSEKTTDIEAGWKFAGSIGGMPARINAAMYQQTVKDVQRTVYLNITSLTGNVEEAEVKGLELDAQLNVSDWLELGAAFAYTDAEFTKPLGDVAGYNFAFGPYADAPETTWSVYFLAETEIDGVGHLSFRGDYYSMDDTYFSNLNDSIGPGTELDAYKLVNLRASLEEIGGSSFSTVVFVRNATDEEYERGGLPLAGVTGTNGTIGGEPRTYGVELKYDF